MEPLDLTKQPPRSPRVKIGGLYGLARTIDRARASIPGGKLGEYSPITNGISNYILDELGIKAEDFIGCVQSSEEDEDVVAWVHAHSRSGGLRRHQ